MYYSSAWVQENHIAEHMTHPSIPDDVRRFIQQCIPSVPFLEAVLLVRDNTGRGWSSAQLAQRLYLSEEAAATLLHGMQQAGIVRADGAPAAPYHYGPSTPELQHIVDRLAQVYASHLIDVSQLIHSKSHRKAQVFADAFIWKKEQ